MINTVFSLIQETHRGEASSISRCGYDSIYGHENIGRKPEWACEMITHDGSAWCGGP